MNLVRFHNTGLNRYLTDQLFRSMDETDTHNRDCGCVPANIVENENDFRLELSIPGFSKDEVKISVQKHVLTIRSEKNTENEENVNYLHRGFVTRNFEKRYQLSKDINPDHITQKRGST